MKRITDPKTGKKETVYNKYSLEGKTFCPECGRQLNEYDFSLIDEIGKRQCVKCGAILTK